MPSEAFVLLFATVSEIEKEHLILTWAPVERPPSHLHSSAILLLLLRDVTAVH